MLCLGLVFPLSRYWVGTRRSQEKMPSWSSAFPARKRCCVRIWRFREKYWVEEMLCLGLVFPGVRYWVGARRSQEKMPSWSSGVPSEGRCCVRIWRFREKYWVEVRHSQRGRGMDGKANFFSDPINGYSERSWHHFDLAAMSSYLGAPGSSPAGKGSEDAELVLGRSQGKKCCVWVWCFRG